jgi:hypothetical protein
VRNCRTVRPRCAASSLPDTLHPTAPPCPGPGEDLTTQELLLLTLCSIAVAPPPPPPPPPAPLGVGLAAPPAPPRQPAADLLLQLAGAHVAAARGELEALLSGHAHASAAPGAALPQARPVAVAAAGGGAGLTPLQAHHHQQLAAAAAAPQHSPPGGFLGALHAHGGGGGNHAHGGGAAAAAAAGAPLHHWTTPSAAAAASGAGAARPPALPEAVACLEALTAIAGGLRASAPAAARDPSKASRQAVAAVLSRSAPRVGGAPGAGLACSVGSGAGPAGSAASGAGSAVSMDDACSASSAGSADARRRGGGRGGRGPRGGSSNGDGSGQAKQGKGGGGGGAAATAAAVAAAAAAAGPALPPPPPLTPAQAAAAARDRRATAVSTQLLAHSWDALRLAFRVVGDGRPGWQALLPAAAGVLEAGLPAVQAQCEAGAPWAARPDGAAGATAAVAPDAAAGAELARECVAQVMLQLLQPLPSPLLREPCCLRLLDRALTAAAAAGLLPSPDGAAEAAAGWGAPGAALLLERQPAVTATAHALLQRALYEACVALLQPDAPPDPALAVAALQLAGAALRAAPQALAAGGALDLLLPATRAALCTQHLEQCSAALLWAQQLVTAPFLEPDGPPRAPLPAPPPPPHWPPQQTALAAAAAAWRAQEAGRRRAALAALRVKLEAGGEGPQVVLSLLLAASGQMPPDVILAVSTCLHSIWRAAGGPAFAGWLEAAVLRLAPDGAPWVRSSRAAKLAFVRDLSDPSNWDDVARFKRAIKSFCTGKRAAGGSGGGGGGR